MCISIWGLCILPHRSPPAVFPRIDGKIQQITFPEDVYVNKFFQTNPNSKHEDPVEYVCYTFFLLIIFLIYITHQITNCVIILKAVVQLYVSA